MESSKRVVNLGRVCYVYRAGRLTMYKTIWILALALLVPSCALDWTPPDLGDSEGGDGYEADVETPEVGADADVDAPACDPEACSFACVSDGYFSGDCAHDLCVCYDGADGDADDDGDGEESGNADADVEVETVAEDGAEGDTDADAEAGIPCAEGWLDPATGLCWENPTGGLLGPWADASSYCAGLRGASGLPWRLPTISELRTLLRGCPATVAGGTCGISDTCSSVSACGSLPSCQWCGDMAGPGPSGCYWPDELGSACGWYWSSIPDPDRPDWTWGVGFNNAAIYDTPRTCAGGACWVRCVRGV